jgi:hypothetical protein
MITKEQVVSLLWKGWFCVVLKKVPDRKDSAVVSADSGNSKTARIS